MLQLPTHTLSRPAAARGAQPLPCSMSSGSQKSKTNKEAAFVQFSKTFASSLERGKLKRNVKT